ncbi:zinc-ribbon domain-containing protein [Celeribacter sp. ULVN23_4]
MRLICPNCGAQYEVDARVIPDTGRDVQCSNCGHSWFQSPAHLDAELADELGYELPPEAEAEDVQPSTAETEASIDAFEAPPEVSDTVEAKPIPEPVEDVIEAPIETPEDSFEAPVEVEDPAQPEESFEEEPKPAPGEMPSAEPEPVAEIEPEEPEVEDEPEFTEPDDDEEDAFAPLAEPQNGAGLKASVRDILRAEVEFDQSMRQSEGETLETQPDLGLQEPEEDNAKKSLRDRMARLRGLDPADSGIVAGSVAAASGKRRDLLPDIEEINSTLSASSERDDDGTVPDDDTRKARSARAGFRTGFLVVVLAAAMLVVLYALAPLIAAKVPALADAMETYVTTANAFRLWLDHLLAEASTRLNTLLGQLNTEN